MSPIGRDGETNKCVQNYFVLFSRFLALFATQTKRNIFVSGLSSFWDERTWLKAHRIAPQYFYVSDESGIFVTQCSKHPDLSTWRLRCKSQPDKSTIKKSKKKICKLLGGNRSKLLPYFGRILANTPSSKSLPHHCIIIHVHRIPCIHEVSAENPIPERAPSCFRFITKQLLNHAPWQKEGHKLFCGLLKTLECPISDLILIQKKGVLRNSAFHFSTVFLRHLLIGLFILRRRKVGIDLGWLLVDPIPMKMKKCPMKRDHFKRNFHRTQASIF